MTRPFLPYESILAISEAVCILLLRGTNNAQLMYLYIIMCGPYSCGSVASALSANSLSHSLPSVSVFLLESQTYQSPTIHSTCYSLSSFLPSPFYAPLCKVASTQQTQLTTNCILYTYVLTWNVVNWCTYISSEQYQTQRNFNDQ